MSQKIRCKKTICLIIMWLVLIQGLLLGMKQIVFYFVNETLYTRSMTTMVSMMILFAIIFLYCQRSKWIMSVFPTKFSSPYIIITIITAIFYGVTLFFVKRLSIQSFLMLLYGSVITPIFEEVLFRGLIWNKLNSCFAKEWKTYLTVTLLFALWHIGYAVGIYFWKSGNLLNIVTMKIMIGAIFGLITGAIRYKTKNCYSGILVHGMLNAFG